MKKKVLLYLAKLLDWLFCVAFGALVGHLVTVEWIDKQFTKRENGRMCSMTYRFSEAYTEGYYKGRDEERDKKPRSAVRSDPYWRVITRKIEP